MKKLIMTELQTFKHGAEHSSKTTLQGFTLAETLITLAVIGFITILIMPTMISKFQNRAFNASATSFEASLGESLKVMNIKKKLAGHGTTENFVNELSRYMKITKICTGDQLLDCFADKVMWGGGDATPEEVDMKEIKKASNFGQKDWKTNVVGVQFANGTNAMIAYNPEAKQDPLDNNVITLRGSHNSNTGSVSLGADTLAILYDTNGFKLPNKNTKDLRSINVQRLGSTNCAFELDGTCFGTPFYPTPMSYAECAGENAISIKTETDAGTYAKSLGIKKCYYENDYWAGAVKQCGGVSNMASAEDLAKIANYAAGRSDIQPEAEKLDIHIDFDKIFALGFHDCYDGHLTYAHDVPIMTSDELVSGMYMTWMVLSGQHDSAGNYSNFVIWPNGPDLYDNITINPAWRRNLGHYEAVCIMD